MQQVHIIRNLEFLEGNDDISIIDSERLKLWSGIVRGGIFVGNTDSRDYLTLAKCRKGGLDRTQAAAEKNGPAWSAMQRIIAADTAQKRGDPWYASAAKA